MVFTAQEDLREKMEEAVNFIRGRSKLIPQCAVVLGTGLGNLADRADKECVLDYSEIPGFASSTAPGHSGKLILGRLSNKPVVMMEGRLHFYEGYSLGEITFPIRVLSRLGAKVLILSNAAGGLNPLYEKGDIAVVTDHINLMGVNPLVGPNDPKLGIRFPDMCEPYSSRLVRIAEKVALEQKIRLQRGVYIGVTGPNLETRAEYRFMRMIGGDLVGMSTVPEVIVGVHAGLEILALSVVTDVCLPDALAPVNIEEIIATAQRSAPVLDKLMEAIVREV